MITKYYYLVRGQFLGDSYKPYDSDVHGDMDGIECMRDCIGRPLLYEGVDYDGRLPKVTARVDPFEGIVQTS